ncbi:unnamed protein product [Gongylonema pulchrum]|uniref:FERM domain-containing protein n=1 Tax=Gongylonema pulchrum TaxID=637853 RepID=A0A183DR29_9BILA|nr:unnamed protein product [Gongylonema pulchrum]
MQRAIQGNGKFRAALDRKNDEKAVETETPMDSDAPQFVRRNSLLPHRISGRKISSSRHLKRKTKAEPELFANQDAPSICLKAPALRKRKVTLHRVEHTYVTVELLNGKLVEVSCRSDAVTSEIADVVMRHMNFNENSFFGLTILRDGEHFFLEGHQRLEKYAPPGWKNARQNRLSKRLYMLFLRFRYYPASLAFIRTEVVMHQLYLQLRRDILDDRIQPKNDLLYDLAAFALQAEFADRPNVAVSNYFDVQHYMPKRVFDNQDESPIIQAIVERHGKYRGMKQHDAEKRFILALQKNCPRHVLCIASDEVTAYLGFGASCAIFCIPPELTLLGIIRLACLLLCQRLPDYGAHLHRVFTSKPSVNLGNTPLGDPGTGVAQWIGILARGIILFEQESGGRHAQTEHLWQNTETLQFDKKRFVIVSEVHEPTTTNWIGLKFIDEPLNRLRFADDVVLIANTK